MALYNSFVREIKYTQKSEKSAFREIFVARYIAILQYPPWTNKEGYSKQIGKIGLQDYVRKCLEIKQKIL